MKNQNIFLIALSVVVLLNTIITTTILFKPQANNLDTLSQNPPVETTPGEEPVRQGPPETISFAEEDRAFGVLKSVDENSLTISRDSENPDDSIQYTIRPTSNAIITDSMRTELDVLREAPQFELNEIPLESVVSAQCDSIVDSVCTAPIIQFTRQTVPEGFNPVEQTP